MAGWYWGFKPEMVGKPWQSYAAVAVPGWRPLDHLMEEWSEDIKGCICGRGPWSPSGQYGQGLLVLPFCEVVATYGWKLLGLPWRKKAWLLSCSLGGRSGTPVCVEETVEKCPPWFKAWPMGPNKWSSGPSPYANADSLFPSRIKSPELKAKQRGLQPRPTWMLLQ